MPKARLIVMTVLAVAAAACGDSAPASPVVTSSVPATTTTSPTTTSTSTPPAPLAGFPQADIVVAGTALRVAIADTAALRTRGLMGVTDLGELDGMLFVFPADTRGAFWMKDTLIPLDIWFFDAAGLLVDGLRMEPCPADPCPLYEAAGAYRYAVETPAGSQAEPGPGALLGIGTP